MTNNGDTAGQWPDGANGAQRGPSFEDPMQPPPPRPAPSAPEQDWTRAWGMDSLQVPAAQDTGFAPGIQASLHGAPTQQSAPYPDQNPYAPPIYGQDPYAVQPSPYQQPYGSYGGYGMYAHAAATKSKPTAAVLAFFLGGFGAHNFYLGKKWLGLTHLVLGLGGFLIMVTAGNVLDTASSSEEILPSFMLLLGFMMWLVNGLWAFIDFVIILVKPEHELGR